MSRRPPLSRRRFLGVCAGGAAVLPALRWRRRRERLAFRAPVFPAGWREPELLSEGPSDPER